MRRQRSCGHYLKGAAPHLGDTKDLPILALIEFSNEREAVALEEVAQEIKGRFKAGASWVRTLEVVEFLEAEATRRRKGA